MWKLGSRPIFATISTYKGETKVHLRHFRLSEQGLWIPLKSGVALNANEWENFKSIINTIDTEYRKINSEYSETIQIPDYILQEDGISLTI